MSVITSVIVSVNYLKVKEKENVVPFISSFSFIVFGGKKCVLTVTVIVKDKMRVFQGSFVREIIEPHYHELENNISCKHISHR